jgi:uncharacterized membrane protein YidH (DUF202 family)
VAPPDDPEDRDPGLARERTRLAWARTAIAFAAVGAAMLRRQPVVGLIVLAITPVVWVLGRVASERMGSKPNARQLLLVTVIVTLVAALAVAVALFGRAPTSLRDLLPRLG